MTDPYTGLTKFGHRYYDPKVGRFTSLDPAKDRRGDNDLYDYCADDPVNRVDRTGLRWKDFPGAGQLPDIMYEVDVMNQAEVKKYYDQKAHEEKYKLDNVLKEGVRNLPSSALNTAKNTATVFFDPARTAWNIASVATGGISKLRNVEDEYSKKTDAVMDNVKGTYLSGWHNFLDALMEDPVGVISGMNILNTLRKGGKGFRNAPKSADMKPDSPSALTPAVELGGNTQKTNQSLPVVPKEKQPANILTTPKVTNSPHSLTRKETNTQNNTVDFLNKPVKSITERQKKQEIIKNQGNSRIKDAAQDFTVDLGIYSNDVDKNSDQKPRTILSPLLDQNINNLPIDTKKKKDEKQKLKNSGFILR